MKHKKFYVVAYDIGDDNRRMKTVKLLESIGTRVNYSVFECFLTDLQYGNMCKQLEKIVIRNEDKIIIYPLTLDCFTRIKYIPSYQQKEAEKIVVI